MASSQTPPKYFVGNVTLINITQSTIDIEVLTELPGIGELQRAEDLVLAAAMGDSKTITTSDVLRAQMLTILRYLSKGDLRVCFEVQIPFDSDRKDIKFVVVKSIGDDAWKEAVRSLDTSSSPGGEVRESPEEVGQPEKSKMTGERPRRGKERRAY